MEYDEGDIAEDGAGNFLVYKYGSWHPSDETGHLSGPIDASAKWGSGARELPNGTIERIGPRGGVSTVANGSDANSEGVGKLTEGQGKSIQYGLMMRGAEADYQRARRDGYDPGSIRNQIAGVAGIIPFDGDFFGRAIRDDVSDAGRQAELRWAEGNLRQLTGAAATNPEIARVAAINFDRGNDELSAQRFQSRADTYRGTRFAAGPGAAALGEYPDYGLPGVGPMDENGLPTYPSIDRILDNGSVAAAMPAAPSGPAAPQGPGFSSDTPVDISGLSASDLMALQPGQYIKFPDGRVERLSGAPRLGAEGEEVSPGVFADEQARVDDVRGAMFSPDQVFARSAMEQVPLAREAMAGITSAFTGNSYQDTRAAQRALADADREQQPVARNMGGVAGATALAATPLGAPLRVTRGASLAGRVVNRAAGGSVAGGAWGFGQGEGNALERLDEAGQGAMFGGIAGPAAPVAANAIGRVAAPVVNGVQAVNRFVGRQAVNALGDAAPTALREAVQPNALASGMRRFADRSPQDVNALNTEASRFGAEEIAPAFADVVNDGGRGTLRALATRQTPARQAAREFADGRAAGLQDRVSTQARRTISDDPRQPAQIREEITTRRNRQADQQFGAVRGDRISPDRDILEALRTPAMRPAIEEAATSAANRGDMETAGALRALAGDALDYGADAQITVGMADRIARSLNGRAEAFKRAGNNDAAASHFAIAERLRGGARQQVPGYDQALNAYAQDSGLASATELGEQFMTMEADQFAAAVAKLSPEEQQIAQAAARRAVERQAGTQGQAPGVAQRLSNGREQGVRTAALVGDAAPVQRAMGAELQTLRNAQGVSPAQGSPTSMNAQDAMGAAGATLDIATGGITGLARRAITAIRSRGFNDAEAQAVVEAAIDPAQTQQLIGMLSERMSRREARNLARAIRYQLTTGPQSGQQQ